ncbi:hypothetical protein Tco_1065333 [Tanacetum coccineum]
MPILEAMMSREVKELHEKGGLEVNAPKKKTTDIATRKHTITFADNMLEDPDEGLQLGDQVNLEEFRKTKKERRTKSKHASLVIEKEVNKCHTPPRQKHEA